jgi:BON domain
VSFKLRPRGVLILVLCISAVLADRGLAQNEIANQQLANDVAAALRQGRLKNFHVDIRAVDGGVELMGRVADLAQRDEALRLARMVPGVRRVDDRLLVVNDRSIVPVQQKEDEQPELAPPPQKMGQPGQPQVLPPSADLPNIPSDCPIAPMPFNLNAPNDQFMRPPPMPPYAWPTYAPYNNYSRVAYPLLYPADAWPAIGPVYPYPKVPLGWRSVQLTWNDGYWWYGKGVNGHDWWRLRYK